VEYDVAGIMWQALGGGAHGRRADVRLQPRRLAARHRLVGQHRAHLVGVSIGGSGAHYRGVRCPVSGSLVPIVGGKVPIIGGSGAHYGGVRCPL